MTKKRFTPAYPAELRERGVRMFRENRADYSSDTAAYKAIAPKLGCSPDSLRVWCQQAERDTGQRAGLTSAEKDRIKELEREVRELRQANEILKKGEPVKAPLVQVHWRTHISQRRSSTARSANDRVHRRSPQRLWCRADLSRCPAGYCAAMPERGGLEIAPSTYYAFKAVERVDSQTKCKFCIKTESCMEDEEWEATIVT